MLSNMLNDLAEAMKALDGKKIEAIDELTALYANLQFIFFAAVERV